MPLDFDGFSLDIASRRLTASTGDIHLEPQAFDVLAFLVENRERVCSKVDILEAVWGDQFVSESALTTRVKQVRKALGDDGRTQKCVRNVHGRGYQFVAEIDGPATAAASSSRPDDIPIRPLEIALDIAVDTEFSFVGRSAELEQARAALAVGSGTYAQVFVGGAAGSGKSRFAVELLDGAADEGRFICAGRCEMHVTSALQAVRDAFAQIAAANPSSTVEWARGIEGPLVSLIPSLVTQLSAEPVPVDAYGGIDVLLTAFERIVNDRPLVMLIDDLQWSDEPTRVFLARLHRRLRRSPITTIYTHRSDRGELPDDVRSWIRDQGRVGEVASIQLDAFDPEEALDLVAAVLGDSAAGLDLVAMTSGHCLFLTETLRDLQLGQTTSESVAELVVARVGRQPQDVQDIVRVGAVLGVEFPFSVAASAAGLDTRAALAAIDDAVAAELLHETSSVDRFRFSHQLLPQAIADSLARTERAVCHQACADALDDLGADEVEVAFHLLGAVPLVPAEEAVERARAAAGRAWEANQFDRALRLLESTLEVGPQTRVRAEILLEIGQLTNAKGLPADAIGVLDQAAEIARTNGWPDLLVAVALSYWSQSPFRKIADPATLDLLAEADALLGDVSTVTKARVIAKAAVFNVFNQRLAERSDSTRRALEMATAAGADDLDRLQLLEARHITFSCPAGVSELDLLDPEIERLREETNVYFSDAAAPETAALMRGRGDELRRVTRGDSSRLAKQPIAEWRDLVVRSTFAAFEGRIDEARELCDQGSEIGGQFWGESAVALHGYGHFFLDLLSGEWSRSIELLELLHAFDGASVFSPALALARLNTVADGEQAETSDLIRPASWSVYGEHIIGGNALIASAELALFVDDDELATAAEGALTPFQDLVLGLPWGAASLAAADPLSRLAARRGDDEAAARHRMRAVELYEGLGAPSLVERMQ